MFFLIGLMGCGKTFFGKKISQKLNYNFIDIDDIVEAELKTTIAETFATKGENYFRQIENKILLQQIEVTNKPTIIATGGGTPCYYNAIDIMNKTGITIWLNTSVNTIAQRLKNQINKRPLLKNIDNNNLQQNLENVLQQRINCYSKSQYQLNVDENATKNIQKIILQYG